MNDHQDRQFDDNMRAIGAAHGPMPTLSERAHTQCAAALRGQSRRGLASRVIRHPACRWTAGLAASIGIIAAVATPWGGGHYSAEAAVIFEKLEKQIAVEHPVLDVTLEDVGVEEVAVSGRIQVSTTAIAGDVKVRIEDDGEAIEVDAALAISQGEGWVLVRKLQLPDPQAQAVVNIFLPPGGDALVILPKDEIDLDFGTDVAEALEKFSSREVITVLQEVIASRAEVGATVEHLRDGTVRVIVPIKSTETLRSIAGVVARAMGEDPGEIDLDDGDGAELVGTTFEVIYDPQAERVQSLDIREFGGSKGRISITIGEGQIDPALLDSAQFTTPQTHVIDLAAVAGMIKRFED